MVAEMERTNEAEVIGRPAGPIVTYEETHVCPACASRIDPACVTSRVLNRTSIEPTRERVNVWCDHCRRGFSAVFGLASGRRQQLSGIVALEGEPLIELLRHIETIRGDVRRIVDAFFPEEGAAGPVPSPDQPPGSEPSSLDAPHVRQLDTDYDAAGAAPVRQLTIDPSTSQVTPPHPGEQRAGWGIE